MKLFLGFDTSCYTTSVAILDETGKLVGESRKILQVKPGKKGLAQSEMVFQHTRNLPEVVGCAVQNLSKPLTISAIGVSGYPRPLPESYMPAFLAGAGYARALSAVYGSPCYQISHQEGHIFAGLWSAGGPLSGEFLALHVSGGTTEIVKVTQGLQGVSVSIIGESVDLHAGQFIDRIGVAMQLPFPAGRHLEALAKTAHEALEIPTSIKGLQASFSGPCSHALRLLAKGMDMAGIAAGVQLAIARTLTKIITLAAQKTGLLDVLLVGGVMSNEFIREYLARELTTQGIKLHFAAREFSSDNAVGPAYYALNYRTI